MAKHRSSAGRIAAFGAVLALHALAIATFVSSDWRIVAVRERVVTIAPITLLLLPVPQIRVFGSILPPLPAPPPVAVPELTPPAFARGPPDRANTLPTPEPNSALPNIGRALSCALDNYDKLLREEKARCVEQLARLTQPTPYSLTTDEQKLQNVWKREYARKEAPFLVPWV